MNEFLYVPDVNLPWFGGRGAMTHSHMFSGHQTNILNETINLSSHPPRQVRAYKGFYQTTNKHSKIIVRNS